VGGKLYPTLSEDPAQGKTMHDWPFELAKFEPGWVWLAGAGPGDAGLLTVYAWHALRSADIVLYDALVDKSVLQLARPGCEMLYAGKRGGKPSSKQVDISLQLVRHARKGKRVLRLKGGDPFVFGRGAEEALALVEAGIPFRVIPGVSAGIGGLEYAGIPLTHRETNEAVTFVTGHNVNGGVPDHLDWAAIARGSPVIVLYMALHHLREIADRLIAGGRAATEPVAIVSKATTPDQSVLETVLAECGEAAAAGDIEPPALVVIGDVVRLRAGLDWAGAMSGRRLDPDPLHLRSERRVS
jgi:uroporphyrin-III C-methyltransferase